MGNYALFTLHHSRISDPSYVHCLSYFAPLCTLQGTDRCENPIFSGKDSLDFLLLYRKTNFHPYLHSGPIPVTMPKLSILTTFPIHVASCTTWLQPLELMFQTVSNLIWHHQVPAPDCPDRVWALVSLKLTLLSRFEETQGTEANVTTVSRSLCGRAVDVWHNSQVTHAFWDR